MKTFLRNFKDLPSMMRAIYVWLLIGGVLSCLMPWLLEKFPPNDPDYVIPTKGEIFEMLLLGVSALIAWYSIHKRMNYSRSIMIILLIAHCIYQLPNVLCGDSKMDFILIVSTAGMVAWGGFYLFKNAKMRAYYGK